MFDNINYFDNPFLAKFDKRNVISKLLSKLNGLFTASGVAVLAVGGGNQTTRTIVDVTMAATDTTFAITHGIVTDPQSVNISFKSVSTALPFLNWARTSASVITIQKTSLTASDSVVRVEIALPSTIS